MVVAAILFFASAIGSGLAFGVTDLIIWRMVGGLGVGAASVIAPAYIAEVSPARVRGRLGSLQRLAIVTGIFAALLSNALLASVSGGAAAPFWFGIDTWRWMFMVEAVPALVYGLAALGLPESPRFLVARGRGRRPRRSCATSPASSTPMPSSHASAIRSSGRSASPSATSSAGRSGSSRSCGSASSSPSSSSSSGST